MPKIGDGWVDGEIRWDDNNNSRRANAAGSSAGDDFQKGFKPNLEGEVNWQRLVDGGRDSGTKSSEEFNGKWRDGFRKLGDDNENQHKSNLSRLMAASNQADRDRVSSSTQAQRLIDQTRTSSTDQDVDRHKRLGSAVEEANRARFASASAWQKQIDKCWQDSHNEELDRTVRRFKQSNYGDMLKFVSACGWQKQIDRCWQDSDKAELDRIVRRFNYNNQGDRLKFASAKGWQDQVDAVMARSDAADRDRIRQRMIFANRNDIYRFMSALSWQRGGDIRRFKSAEDTERRLTDLADNATKRRNEIVRQSILADDFQYKTHHSQRIASYQALEAQRVKSAAAAAAAEAAALRETEALEKKRIAAAIAHEHELQRIKTDIIRNTEADRRISLHMEEEGKRAGDAYAREVNKGFEQMLRAYRDALGRADNDHHSSISRRLSKTNTDVDRHSHIWAQTMTRAMSGGIQEGEGMFAAAGLNIFEAFAQPFAHGFRGLGQGLSSLVRTMLDAGGPVGDAVIAGMLALGSAVVVSLGAVVATWVASMAGVIIVALGAALALAAGAVLAGGFLGIAAAAIAGGVMFLKGDPRVGAAMEDFKKHAIDKVLSTKGVWLFRDAMVGAVNAVSDAFNRWGPIIGNVLGGASKLLPILTTGIIGFVDKLLPAIDRLMNSPFMKDLMKVFAEGLVRLGAAFSKFINDFLSNGPAMQGTLHALADLFLILAGAVIGLGHVLGDLAALWDRLRANKDVLDMFRVLGDLLNFIWMKFFQLVERIAANNDAMQGFQIMLKATGSVLGFVIDSIGFLIIWAGRLTLKFQELWKHSGAFRLVMIGLLVVLGLVVVGFIAFIAAFLLVGVVLAAVLAVGVAMFVGFLLGFKTILSWLYQTWIATWHAVREFFLNTWHTIVEQFNLFLTMVKTAWNQTWGEVKAWAAQHWHDILALLMGWIQNIQNWIGTALLWIRTTWGDAWVWAKEHLIMIWNLITTLISTKIEEARALIHNKLEEIRNRWVAIWTDVHAFVATRWEEMKALVNAAFETIRNWINEKLFQIRATWNEIWSDVHRLLHDRWEDIKSLVAAATEFVHLAIHNFLETIRNKWDEIWALIALILKTVWENIKQNVTEAIEFVRVVLETALAKINAGWNQMWEGVHAFFAGIWNKIGESAAQGINHVISVLNSGIDKINAVLDKIGVGFKIEHIGEVAGPGPLPVGGSVKPQGNKGGVAAGGFIGANSQPTGYAGGGRLYGPGSGTADLIPTRLRETGGQGPWVSNDEFVMNARASQSLGYGNLEHMNRYGKMPGLASGGRVGGPWALAGGGKIVWVGANGDNEGLMNEHQDHLHVAMQAGFQAVLAAAAASGIPFSPSSTVRVGTVGSNGQPDLHTRGMAVDFAGADQDALAAYFAGVPGVIELIHRTHKGDYGIFGGGGGGGIMALLNQFLAKGIGFVMDSMMNPAIDEAKGAIGGGTWPKELAKGVLEKLKEGLKKKIEDFIAKAATAKGGASGPLTTAPGSPAQVAYEQAKLMGASPKALLSLFETGIVESRWQNSSSMTDHDSVGILQQRTSQGWGSVADLMNPAFQVRNFLSRWTDAGTPGQSAQAVQRSGFPDRYDQAEAEARAMLHALGAPGFAYGGRIGGTHDNGGLFPHNSLAINMSKKPEMILNNSQASALEHRIKGDENGGGCSPSITVMIDGVEVAYKVLVEDNNNELVSAFKRGRGV